MLEDEEGGIYMSAGKPGVRGGEVIRAPVGPPVKDVVYVPAS